MRPMKLRATRSAVRMARALPEIRAITAPGATVAPSAINVSKRMAGLRLANAACATCNPETTPGARAAMTASMTASAGTVASVVISPRNPKSSASAALTALAIKIAGIGAGAESWLSPAFTRTASGFTAWGFATVGFTTVGFMADNLPGRGTWRARHPNVRFFPNRPGS